MKLIKTIMDFSTKLKELKKLRLSDLFVKEKIKKFIDYERELAHNPHKLALSFALGVFVGLAVPMGLQTLLALPIALLLRCNVLVVYIASLITNPFTAVFIYAMMFKVGEMITGNHLSYEQVEYILNNLSITKISQIGSIAFNNLLIGMIILTFILTPLSYYAVLLYVNRKKYFSIKKNSNKN